MASEIPGSTATRAPSRAALVSTCQTSNARPNSKMLTEMSSSSGSVNAISSSAAPADPAAVASNELSWHSLRYVQRRHDGANGNRGGVRKPVVALDVLDRVSIRPN